MNKNNSRILSLEIEPKNRVSILGDHKLEGIHQATLTILEEIGVNLPSRKSLEIFAEAGADVDFDKEKVKIPSDLVIKALDNAPRKFTLGSRGGAKLDLKLDGVKTYFTTDGTGIASVDLETRKRRPSTRQDMERMALIADYLPCISLYWDMVSDQINPSFHELEPSVIFNEKHIQTDPTEKLRQPDADPAKASHYLVKVATLLSGDAETLKNRPPLSIVNCTISPLGLDANGIEGALISGEAGLPVTFITMPTLASTAPASVAGTILTGNAELLSAITLMQVYSPGAPVLYSFMSGMLNPHTAEFIGNRLTELIDAVGIQLAHHYNLPAQGPSFHCGWQARKPGTFLGRHYCPGATILSGPDVVTGLGLLEYGTLLYPEKLIFDCELFKDFYTFTKGIDVTSESLTVARDEIMNVGPRGHFLTTKSTQRNLRDLWDPGISYQWSPESGDFKDPQEAALDMIKWILENHKPNPLDEAIKKEMWEIFEQADKELGNKNY